MPKLVLLTAVGGPIELVEFPLTRPAPGTAALRLRMVAIGMSFLEHTSFPFDKSMPEPYRLADVNAAFASAGSGSVPRGALVP